MFHAALGIDGDSIEPVLSGVGRKIAVFLSGVAGVSCHREQRSAFRSGMTASGIPDMWLMTSL